MRDVFHHLARRWNDLTMLEVIDGVHQAFNHRLMISIDQVDCNCKRRRLASEEGCAYCDRTAALDAYCTYKHCMAWLVSEQAATACRPLTLYAGGSGGRAASTHQHRHRADSLI